VCAALTYGWGCPHCIEHFSLKAAATVPIQDRCLLGCCLIACEGDIMAKATYIAEMTIERGPGAIRTVQLPAEPSPVHFGVHGTIAKHYGLNPANITEPRAATLDYVIAAAAA
jgi:hypothetical protein